MDIVTLLPFVVLIGVMFVMTRSAKNKQQQAMQMRDRMQPGSGVRTIGGMYATVKEVADDTALLEVAPGIHVHYAKNAIGAVLDDGEYNRIVHGIDPGADTPVVPDDASSLVTDTPEAPAAPAKGNAPRIDLGKSDTDGSATSTGADDSEDGKKGDDADAK